ncbi:MAG: hypothetical protein ACRD6R_05620 [Candidatus Polarisedimenticolia bacterium]
MSATCGVGASGDVSHSLGSDDVWHCAREEERQSGNPPQDYNMLEHFWRFQNIPPGRQFLQFEGHKAAGSLDEGAFGTQAADDFRFLGKSVSPGVPCPLDVGDNAIFNHLSSGSDYATFIHGTEDASGIITMNETTVRLDLCVLVMSVKACPDDPPCPFEQVDVEDVQKDLVYMDRIAICTLPPT